MTLVRGKGKEADEFAWKDEDRCHGRVIGYDQVRLEQGAVADDVAALIEVGNPPRNGIIDAIPVYLTAEQAVDAALALLDAAGRTRAESDPDGPPKGPVADDDQDRRWRLHVHAASIADMTFWIERVEGGFRAVEVESGVAAAVAPTEREAMDNYLGEPLVTSNG